MDNSKVPVQTSIMKTTEDWGACVARAFLCNYLVCLAVWQATAAQDISSKILGILFPVGGEQWIPLSCREAKSGLLNASISA